MTRRELNLAIFEGTTDKVLWQPRLETWIEHHIRHDTLPGRFKGLDSLGIYDALRCSVRYEAGVGLEYYEEPDDITRMEERQGDRVHRTITTPSGSVTTVHREIWRDGKLGNTRIEKYPVSSVADLKVIVDVIERTQCRANQKAHEDAAQRVGHRAEPTAFLTSSGFTNLIKEWCGLEGTFLMLHAHRDAVEAYLEACDRLDDRVIDAALQLPIRIFNLGDHATNEFTPPPILTRYMLPRWQRLSERLHQHGRFVHSHWDGNSAQIIPYLQDTGLDAVESLTPEPMCDMALEQIKAAVGDKMICLDLIPAIFFLEHYSTDFVVEFTRRVVDMFAPRLILGISDEISQIGQIEKVEAISELVDSVCGLAD
jgi:hypothetical protein